MSWPTTTDPREVFVTVRLTDSEANDLDTMRATTGQSRSEAVREAIYTAVMASKQISRKKQALGGSNPAGA